MPKKKLGKILLLSTIPHYLIWMICIPIFEISPNKLPVWMVLWVLGIFLLLIPAVYMSEETTPKQTWKDIINFINE